MMEIPNIKWFGLEKQGGSTIGMGVSYSSHFDLNSDHMMGWVKKI